MLMTWTILLILVIVLGMVVGRVIRARRQRVAQPSCGNCGYFVTGLNTHICPECGSNLNEVGVATPQSAAVRPPSLMTALVIWTVVAGISGWFLTTLVRLTWPRTAEWTGTTSFRLGEPASGAYSFISMDQQVQMPGGRAINAPVVVRVWGPGIASSVMPLVVYVATNEIEFWDSEETRHRRPLTEDSVKEWFESRGLDVSSEATAAELSSMVRVLSDSSHWQPLLRRSAGSVSKSGFELIGAGFDDTTMTSDMVGTYPIKWVDVVPGLFWWLLWLAGIVVIVQRYQRS